MKNPRIIAIIAVAIVGLLGAGITFAQTQKTDWREAAYDLGVSATKDDPTTCEETILGGPAEVKTMVVGVLLGEAEGRTYGEMKTDLGAVSGDSENTPEEQALVDSIPDDVLMAELVPVLADGMYAKCGV